VTLKLKTADFKILTRRATPPRPPASAEELARLGVALLGRVELPGTTRFRLAGLGLSNFPDDDGDTQPLLFGDDSA
jgi:DNA polymerase-4